MDQIEDAFGTLADTDHWEEAVGVLAGFLAPTVLHNVVSGRMGMEVPDEAYGVGIIALASFSPMYAREMQVGGGVYVADKALERFGLKSTITNLGGS